MLNLEYLGKVQAQQRPRFQVVKTKDGRAFPHTYEKDECKNFKATIHLMAQDVLNKSDAKPYEDAVELTLVVRVKLPASMSKKDRRMVDAGLLYPTKKPDVDNVLKAVMDALNGVWYRDDKQVVSVHVHKQWADMDGLKIYVTGMNDEK